MMSRNQQYRSITINLNRINPSELQTFKRRLENLSSYALINIQIILPDKSTYVKSLDESLIHKGMVIDDLPRERIDLANALFEIPKLDLKEQIDTFFMFLYTGYLEINIDRAMVFLYLGILLDVKKLVSELIVQVLPEREMSRMWEVILFVFNDFPRGIMYIKELLNKNTNFLVDSNNQTSINQKFLRLKSIIQVESFLRCLIDIMTENKRLKVTDQYRKLIEVLYKYYVYKNKLAPSEFSNKKIDKIVGDNVESGARTYDIDEIDDFIGDLKKRQAALEILENDFKREAYKAEQQMDDYKKRIEKLDSEIAKAKNFVPDRKLTVANAGHIYHRQDMKSHCKCKEGIRLQCKHISCKECMLIWFMTIVNETQKAPTHKMGQLKCLETYEPSNKCRHILSEKEIEDLSVLASIAQQQQ